MNKSLPRLSWRMIVLNLILPFNLILLMFTLFIQVWFLQFDVDVDGLQAKRFMAEPLLEVFSDKAEEKKEVPPWIAMVTLEDGSISYPDESAGDYIADMIDPEVSDRRQAFISAMVAGIPVDMSIASFRYQGQKGLCFYFNDALPGAFRVLQKPRYLINLFLVATLLFLLGAGIILNLKRNMDELIKATRRIRELDFDTPLIPRRDNELSTVFTAFDEMRKEMNYHRKQGSLLIMSITHDLKTPLTSIRGYLEAFRDGVIDSTEDVTPIIGTLLDKTNLLEERINEMLEFSKTVSGNFDLEGKPILVKQWLTGLNLYFEEESLLHQKKYSYVDSVPENMILSGQEKKLSRAVINLFDNARRYTDGDDVIRFSSAYDGDEKFLILRMEDSGKGVKADNREKIFDLFYRQDKGRNTRGMGIGLASVKFMVELHRGSIRCLDSELGGACFEIRLPIETV